MYLPIYIDRRRVHICKLRAGAPEISPSHFECIVPHEEGTTLLAIKKGTRLLSTKGTASDIPFFTSDPEKGMVQNLSLSFVKKGESLIIEIIEVPADHLSLEENNGAVLDYFGISYSVTDQKLVLSNTAYRARNISCELRYQQLSCCLVFQMAPNTHIVNAVFDFGSEASQVAPLFDDSYDITPMSLVHHTYDHFYKNAFPSMNPQLTDFYQYEDDQNHKHVLLSYFFIKAEGALHDKTGHPFKNGAQSLVKILTSDTEEAFITNLNKSNTDGHFLIPNLKLADSMSFSGIGYQLQNGQRGNFENKEVKDLVFQTILNQFLHLLLKRIEAYYSQNKSNEKIHLRLNLLVPNIYPQQRVSRLLSTFQENIKEIYAREYPKFKGIEIYTSSESDASFDFKEYRASKKRVQDKDDHCLLIDAGKGTTDFSIIRCNLKTNTFLSIYRSGMAGAGNLITYAIMETIVAVITNGNATKSKKFIKEKILSGDLSRQLQFFKLLERIKKEYDDLAPVPPEKVFGSGGLSYNNIQLEHFYDSGNGLVQLNVFLEKMLADNLRLGDYHGIIHTTLENYTDKLIKDIQMSQLEKFHMIRLAGRAFGFRELNGMLRKKLRKFSKDIVALEDPKGMCLQNSLNAKVNINENSNMVGIPVIAEKGSIFSGKFSQFMNRLDTEINAKKEDSPKESTANLQEHGDFFIRGINYRGTDLENVKIGGFEYELEHAHMKTETELNLIFVGDKFLARSATASTVLKLNPKMAKINDPDVIKSLFPNLPSHNGIPITPPKEDTDGYRTISQESTVHKYIKILGKTH